MKTLACLASFYRQQAGVPSVYGFDSAVIGMFAALLEHGQLDRVHAFASPLFVGPFSEAFPHPKLDVHSELEFLGGLDQHAIDVWQDPHDTSLGVYARSAFGTRLFPFINVSHCYSNPDQLRTNFALEMLLVPWEACDSYICTSRTARKVAAESLAVCTEGIEAQTGAKLAFGGRLDVIPLGIDTSLFAPLDKRAAREELGLNPSANIILWFGRWSATDKADLLPLLLVFKRLLLKHPNDNLQLVLAGNDVTTEGLEFRPALEAYASSLELGDALVFLQGFPKERRAVLYAAADVFTSPIDCPQETFGLTPIEAMACGTPQVVSDWDGYRDTVVNGETGFLVPTLWSAQSDSDLSRLAFFPTDIVQSFHGFSLGQSIVLDLDAYELAFETILFNEETKRSMSEASRRRACAEYDWRVIIAKYRDLWAELGTISKAMASKWRPRKMLMAQEYNRRFASYPSAMVSGHEQLSLTEEGRALLSEKHAFPWHYEIERGLVDQEALLNKLRRLDQGGAVAFSALVERTGSADFDAIDTRRVLWLLKHGFARIQKPAKA